MRTELGKDALADEIHKCLREDTVHSHFYESIQTADEIVEIIYLVFCFLDIYPSLGQQLHQDNLYDTLYHLITKLRPDMPIREKHLFYITFCATRDCPMHKKRRNRCFFLCK